VNIAGGGGDSCWCGNEGGRESEFLLAASGGLGELSFLFQDGGITVHEMGQ
jgi:hypothetical protein